MEGRLFQKGTYTHQGVPGTVLVLGGGIQFDKCETDTLKKYDEKLRGEL
jgi:hypothetical protein